MTSPPRLLDPVNLFDIERLGRDALDSSAADYIAGGSEDELTLRGNREAWEALALRPRCLVDVSARDMSTTLLGAPLTLPVLVAPTGFQMLAHPDAELATARAAHGAGTIMVLSTFSTRSLEEVAAAAGGRRWFQLYVHRDRGLTRALVERAAAARYEALVLTVDLPIIGRRERDLRNTFSLPVAMRVANFAEAQSAALHDGQAGSGLEQFHRGLRDPAFTWKDLDWLASLTDLPLILKGVLRGDDAERSLDHGVRGIIVSNHGGRQLDGALPAADALPDIVAALAGRAEVMVDGGVRRGTDVIKALALGARAVLLGRPVLWGLAWRGEQGVRRVFELLRQELDTAMALCGIPALTEVTADLVA